MILRTAPGDAAPDRILTRPVSASERLVDDDHWLGSWRIDVGQRTSTDDADAQRVEISADHPLVCHGVIEGPRRGRRVLNGEDAAFAYGQRQVDRRADGGDSGHAPDAVDQAQVE